MDNDTLFERVRRAMLDLHNEAVDRGGVVTDKRLAPAAMIRATPEIVVLVVDRAAALDCGLDEENVDDFMNAAGAAASRAFDAITERLP